MNYNFQQYRRHWDTAPDLQTALHKVGASPEKEADLQYDFMIRMGLDPTDKFLDLPCGCLRGTIRLVDYMQQGRFFGADISPKMIAAAFDHITEKKYDKSPTLKVIDDFDLPKYFSTKFDFILSVSLLTHIFPQDVADLFTGIKKVLRSTGKWYFTIYPLSEENQQTWKGEIDLTFYKVSYLQALGVGAGLKIRELVGAYPNPYENPHLPVVNSNLGQWVMEATHL